ncbi:unnamed protein product [Blepharisma stoltei]|uniref:C2H2-type domain-containing protein n=1 Tax=Blepharisma stoltei TaxID=1481888 RepID=A0AAU9IHD8_9CILI|nr:unnamed protein product [Blepharisma stoltei]
MLQASQDRSDLHCHEQYSSPIADLQCKGNYCILKDYHSYSFPHFCCMAHESLFAEDFESEEEDISIPLSHNTVKEIYFLDKIPDEMQLEISAMKNKQDISSQCNAGPPVSLSQLSMLPCLGQKEDKILCARYRPNVINHTPVIYVSRDEYEEFDECGIKYKFVCKACSKEFKSGQALGGHMSRSHPGYVESEARKLRKIQEDL